MTVVTVFNCDFCKNYNSSQEVMKRHEQECVNNPVNHTCLTCGKFFIDINIVDHIFYKAKPKCSEGILISSYGKTDLNHKTIQHCPKWKSTNQKIK